MAPLPEDARNYGLPFLAVESPSCVTVCPVRLGSGHGFGLFSSCGLWLVTVTPEELPTYVDLAAAQAPVPGPTSTHGVKAPRFAAGCARP